MMTWHFTAFHCSHYNCLIFGCLIFLYITQISETLKTKSNTDLIIVITISLNMVLLFWGFSRLSWHACCVHPWGWSSWDRTCGISTTKQQDASLGLFLLFSLSPHPQLFLPVKNFSSHRHQFLLTGRCLIVGVTFSNIYGLYSTTWSTFRQL